ncbi:MAG: putative nicotinate-nucleotide adenylyltransferase [Thermoanaerobaculia bacterium]|nr:putative nicotinate-nucleotide adenylyltransferase [Thermoanaerobaculia bacterium]
MSEPLARLGIYGGSFDPIHQGHLVPVEEARVHHAIDSVLFVPAHAAPHKPSGTSASSHHRFAMTALAIASYPAFSLTDFEATRGGTTYTIETLRHFRANYPGTEVLLVLGSDSLINLHSWRAWQEIARDHRIIAIYREPVSYSALQEGLVPELRPFLAPESATLSDSPEESRIFWGGNAPVTISSTWIRKQLEEGSSLQDAVPPAVETYLRRQRLYGLP